MSDDVSIPNPSYRGKRSARYARSQGRMDPDTKRLVMFAGGLGSVLVCLIAASTLIGHHSTTVPVIAADTAPIKVRPENPGGMQIDAAENDVFSGGTDPSTAKLAPPAETPNPNGLHERPKPVAQASVAAMSAEAKPAVGVTPPPVPAKPVVVASAAKPPLLARSETPAKPETLGKPETSGKSETLTKSEALTKAETPAASAASGNATPSTTTARPPSPSAAMSGRSASVQLAALTTEQAAHEEWQQITKRMPELLNGHQPVFTHIEHDGHSFWRVRTSGFTDATQARTFCEHVKAKGGSC